jgi:hypothetical protein
VKKQTHENHKGSQKKKNAKKTWQKNANTHKKTQNTKKRLKRLKRIENQNA